MTLEEMKARKVELGYTNETVARLSGVPLGTVQKIFSGETKSPRYNTIQKLQAVLNPDPSYTLDNDAKFEDAESGNAYNAASNWQEKLRNKKPLPIKPRKIKLGMFEGKYKMPPEELFYNDDIAELFEDE